MTILYTNPIFLAHETGRHPESPERLRAITAQLDMSDLKKNCTMGRFDPIDEHFLESLHTPKQITTAKQLSQHGGGMIDADTIVSRDSWNVALHAVGACTNAVDEVVKGTDKNALCLVRPPGHHATENRSMGFCLFNNIALAAQRARTEHEISRLLIVDWDVHHGNGTQDIFYDDPEVFFFSAHRYPFYPGTGDSTETGTGKGLGFTRNIPMRFGISRKDYHAQFSAALGECADKIKPDLVLLSAGFDAHTEDPVGSLGLETEDFVSLSEIVMQVADTHANGRLVSCLEGGYNTVRLAECVEAHLRCLLSTKK